MTDDGDGWADVSNLPHWERYALGVRSVEIANDDPQKTMQVAVTERELALWVFGLILVVRLFPEIVEVVEMSLTKLRELSAAQEFLPWESPDDLPEEGEDGAE